jgi:hypothetical protein
MNDGAKHEHHISTELRNADLSSGHRFSWHARGAVDTKIILAPCITAFVSAICQRRELTLSGPTERSTLMAANSGHRGGAAWRLCGRPMNGRWFCRGCGLARCWLCRSFDLSLSRSLCPLCNRYQESEPRGIKRCPFGWVIVTVAAFSHLDWALRSDHANFQGEATSCWRCSPQQPHPLRCWVLPLLPIYLAGSPHLRRLLRLVRLRSASFRSASIQRRRP